jgi:hypothetical protein
MGQSTKETMIYFAIVMMSVIAIQLESDRLRLTAIGLIFMIGIFAVFLEYKNEKHKKIEQ